MLSPSSLRGAQRRGNLVVSHGDQIEVASLTLAMTRVRRRGDPRELAQQDIHGTDPDIDRVLYDLYGLTDDEIKIVEEATAT